MVSMTTSEVARHVRAELEALASGLPLEELVQLLAVGRRLLEERDARAGRETLRPAHAA